MRGGDVVGDQGGGCWRMRIPDRGGVRWCLFGVRRIGERDAGGCGYGWCVGFTCFGVDGVGDSGGDEPLDFAIFTNFGRLLGLGHPRGCFGFDFLALVVVAMVLVRSWGRC